MIGHTGKTVETPKADKALSKRQRKAQRKRDNLPGAHAASMAAMKARNGGSA